MRAAVFAKYYEAGRISFRNRATYILNLWARTITVGIRIWIFYQLYHATYLSAGIDNIGGLELVELMWILALTQSFQTATRPPPVSSFIEEEIKSGEFAYTVNRPYSYLLFHLSSYLGRTLPTLLFNLAVTAIIVLILTGRAEVSAKGLICGTILLIFGLILDFFMTFIIGLLALWIEEVQSVYYIYQKLQLVLGGQVVPLALFPDAIRGVTELSPFALLYYGASRIMIDFNLSVFLQYLSFQLIWLAVFGILASLLFMRGTKIVSINGG